MATDLWLTFVAASIVLLIIPGPTIIMVVSQALAHGRRTALASVAGVAPWIVPPPLTTEKVTVTPATGSPAASRTTTDGAKGTASPAAAC